MWTHLTDIATKGGAFKGVRRAADGQRNPAVQLHDSYMGRPTSLALSWALYLTLQAVANNKGGSYMTMFSKGGFIFGVINIIGNFGTVFGAYLTISWCSGAGTPAPSLVPMLVFFHPTVLTVLVCSCLSAVDQAYWLGAIASRPSGECRRGQQACCGTPAHAAC